MPSLFETVVLTEDGHENAPETDVPYYLDAAESYFLVKPTEIGTVFLPEHTRPKSLKKLGHAGGVFTWKGDPIPGNIISQAHHFFLRIFDTKHAEAEVLLTKHLDTGAYRLFVPYQRVSHMGVKSIYEPTHIDRKYVVVGTLHSHCDFGAFHSNTDSGDASDMDGVHFTIGKVNSTPEIVGMVTMNGKEFHYKNPADIATIEYGTNTAPPWWDNYVFAGDEAPKTKPASLVSLSQADWDEFLGRALRTPKHITVAPPSVVRSPTWWDQNKHNRASEDDWRKHVYGGWRPKKADVPSTEFVATDQRIDDALDMAERIGVFSDEDWDDVHDKDRDEIGYWQGFFVNRLAGLLDTLEILGVSYLVARQAAPDKPHKRGKK